MESRTSTGFVSDFAGAKPRRNEVVGEHGDAVKLKVAAPAVDGKANEALLAYVAELLEVPRRSLTLSAGEKSRDKSIIVEGLEIEEVRRRLLQRG